MYEGSKADAHHHGSGVNLQRQQAEQLRAQYQAMHTAQRSTAGGYIGKTVAEGRTCVRVTWYPSGTIVGAMLERS
jgi:hypothetical protein